MSSDDLIYIDLRELSGRIGQAMGCDMAEAQNMILALTRAFHNNIKEYGVVDLPGIGIFKATGKNYIDFKPSDQFTAEVNAPFSMFAPVEVSPEECEALGMVREGDVYYEKGEQPVMPPLYIPQPEENIPVENINENSPVENNSFTDTESISEPPVANTLTEDTPEEEPDTIPEDTSSMTPDFETETEVGNDIDDVYSDEMSYEDEPPRHRFPILIYLLGLASGLAVAACIWFFLTPDSVKNSKIPSLPSLPSDSLRITQVNVERLIVNGKEITGLEETPLMDGCDSVAQTKVVEQLPEPKIVTDTVATGKYLTTMAKRHYGNKDFWVYIYQENSSKLRHPDRIAPGTVLVIPPIEKYVHPGSSEDSIHRAVAAKTGEIYRAYR